MSTGVVIVDEKARLRFNLIALQQLDPEITSIDFTASHVAVYQLKEKGWRKLKIDGTFFILRAGTSYRLFVLNILSLDNLQEEITENFKFELMEQSSTGEVICYQNEREEIYGLWFYDKTELQGVMNCLNKIKNSLHRIPTAAPAVPAAVISKVTTVSISPAALFQAHAKYAQPVNVHNPSLPAEMRTPSKKIDKAHFNKLLSGLVGEEELVEKVFQLYKAKKTGE